MLDLARYMLSCSLQWDLPVYNLLIVACQDADMMDEEIDVLKQLCHVGQDASGERMFRGAASSAASVRLLIAGQSMYPVVCSDSVLAPCSALLERLQSAHRRSGVDNARVD